MLGEVRATPAREYDDGRPLDSATQVPLSELDALSAQVFPEPADQPASRSPGAWSAAWCTTCARPTRRHQVVPQRNVPSRQAQWFVLSRLDSATVATPDGRGVTFRRRDPALFRSMLERAVAQHREIAKAWPDLRRRYRDGAARAHEPRGLGGARCSTGA